jgi:hypothetical protein
VAKLKTILPRVMAMGVGLLLAIVLAEVGVRLLVSPARWQLHNTGDDWRPHDRLGWAFQQNLDLESSFRGEVIHFQTNEDGLIPATTQRERSPAIMRVILVGDSTTAARNVNQDDTLQAHLQHVLGDEVEVINAGVEGYSTDQVYILMQELLPIYQPDVVVYTFTVNDLGGISSDVAYGTTKPMFIINEDGHLQEVPPEGVYDPFPEPFSPRWILVRSALWRALQPVIVPLRARLQGWDELVADPLLYYYDTEFLDHFDWPLFEALVAEMNVLARENEARFLLTSHAQLDEVWQPQIDASRADLGTDAENYDPYIIENRLAGIAESLDIPFCPYIDYFVDHQERGPFHLLNDSHNNGAGYLLKAETLQTCFEEYGVLE